MKIKMIVTEIKRDDDIMRRKTDYKLTVDAIGEDGKRTHQGRLCITTDKVPDFKIDEIVELEVKPYLSPEAYMAGDVNYVETGEETDQVCTKE